MAESNNPEGSLADDLSSLQEAGYDTSDAGTGNKSMSERDVADLTDTSSSKAAEAGHEARDHMADSGDMGIPSDRHD